MTMNSFSDIEGNKGLLKNNYDAQNSEIGEALSRKLKKSLEKMRAQMAETNNNEVLK